MHCVVSFHIVHIFFCIVLHCSHICIVPHCSCIRTVMHCSRIRIVPHCSRNLSCVEPNGVQALKNPNPLKDVEALVVLVVAVLV